MKFYVYIIKCSNGSYYIGHTHNLHKRYVRHRIGTGAHHTAVNAPEEIVYTEQFDSEADAVRRERQLKRWSRAKKQALIDGRVEDLRRLSRSHD